MTARPCPSCGRLLDAMPADLAPRYRELLERMTVLCDECAAEADAAEERERAEREERERANALRRRRARSGLPERLRGLRLSDPEHPDAVQAASRFAAGELRGLLLTGEVGAGKTHMAAATAWAYLDRRPLRWYSTPVLFAHLGTAFEDQLHKTAIEALVATRALVLDDADKAKPSEYAAQQIFTAVDQRITAGAPLLVTTNLGLGELAGRWPEPYGDAIVDRLASYCESFRFAGESRRFGEAASG